MPSLTIGVPAYNNEKTIEAAITSLLHQTSGDFRILISDDASTDNTEEICRTLASIDSRIVYSRNAENLNYGNFHRVLSMADTQFFMWAAGDDRWHPRFVETCLDEFRQWPTAVTVVPDVLFEVTGKPHSKARGTYALLGTPSENIWRYLCDPSDNSRMYGIHRTCAAQSSFPALSFHAFDWAFSAATLRYGIHVNIPATLMYRDRTPPERYIDMVKRDNNTVSDRLFPLWPMTRWLLTDARIPVDFKIAAVLLDLNLHAHFAYTERYHLRYARYTRLVRNVWKRQISWRVRHSENPNT